MAPRAYLATSRDALRALADEGALPAGSYVAVVAASADEEDEYDAMAIAAEDGEERWGEVLVVVTDAPAGRAPEGAVDLDDVAAIHVTDELAWYATQELEAVLDDLDDAAG